MGMYPEKPRRDRGEWSEWILDECGLERAPEREPRLVLRLAVALGEFQKAVHDFESWNKEEAQRNPEKRRTTLIAWAEWICDECEIERDEQVVAHMALALDQLQKTILRAQLLLPMPPGSWPYILERFGKAKWKESDGGLAHQLGIAPPEPEDPQDPRPE